MGVIDKAPPDVQAQAHATLGRVYLKGYKGTGDNLAKAEYSKVRGIWADPAKAEAGIRAAYPTEDAGAQDRRLAKALNAVGEAYFFAAEERRKAEVDNLKSRPTRARATRRPPQAHQLEGHRVVRQEEGSHREGGARVHQDPSSSSPSRRRSGSSPPALAPVSCGVTSSTTSAARRSRPPGRRTPSSAAVYYDALDAASEPFKVRNAKPALKKCLDLSVKYQYFDEFSRNCEVWLAKNYKSEYHVVDELRGAPTLSNSGLDEKAPPVLTDGTFWHPPAAAPEKTTVSTTEEGGGAADPKPKAGGGGGAKPAAAKPGGARPLPGGKKK